MGYPEGCKTLEYVLDYARKLHGLSGGITPAQIWKKYTQSILRGEPIEQFDGVKLPEEATASAVKNGPDTARGDAAGLRNRKMVPRSPRAATSSVAPSSARASRAKRTGSTHYRALPSRSASSSASAAPR
jgi:hypothetical protein